VYNRENEGIAIMNRIKLGIKVHTTSSKVLWVTLEGSILQFDSKVNWLRIWNKKYATKILIRMRKNIISWCKSIRLFIAIVAGS